ncbi:MAG: glucosyl-transferase [Candidatus Gottesmanbacteria bacterium GW2011_GWA2_47_9]|uniref:Glucosyl-transferase n=2 Tax=Microgenomates group TaxID=1794810 RepID=A0A0G1U465_9BACT|nr:MAG: glucosyl-transferase [Candidatus Woesebacteria bacterium GW2011_GWA1_43_12]KKU88849.1 MAG: glucosyl-transferase [Candidatus Gottesmanbacteria bacterium GW2011_GWA2_47_9]
MKISVVISARNEESKLGRCLASVAWADEVVVIDNSSTDGTARIAREFGAKVFRRPNNLMLNVNKNFGFEKASGDWIFSLDADEEVTKDLAKEIQERVMSKEQSDSSGYWIPRKNIIFGKWITHGLWWPDKQLRIFRRSKGRFPCVHVHEYLEVDGSTKELTEPYVHYNYETISQFIRKMDTIYSESEVQKLIRTNYQWTWHDAIRFPVSDFVKVFFAQEGYKDGLHGLMLAMLQAFYSFVVFAKLWEQSKFEQKELTVGGIDGELQRNHREIRYWVLSEQIKETRSIIEKIRLKLLRRYGKSH